MTAVTGTLAGWLLDQIAADERLARDCTAAEWRIEPYTYGPVEDHGPPTPQIVSDMGDVITHQPYEGGGFVGHCEQQDAQHVARWDPARVLAECEAKRRIVEVFVATAKVHRCSTDELFFGETLRLLALPYADRAGYRREEWAP